MSYGVISGQRSIFGFGDKQYPAVLRDIPDPPHKLYVIGDPAALTQGLAVVGARKATPYGRSCARRFALLAAERGITIISGGARGCDAEAHRAALEAGGKTVAFLGGGCDEIYPVEHVPLFQRIVDSGGAIVSEHPWNFVPLPYTFRARNRLIAGLSFAVLIVEAGLPSGTFSTADEALDAGREVFVVPGSISSPSSRGSNRLLAQGAVPIVDDESFEDALFRAGASLKRPKSATSQDEGLEDEEIDEQFGEAVIVQAAIARPSTMDELYDLAFEAYGAAQARSALMDQLAAAETAGVLARHSDGRWGPKVGRSKR